MPIHSKISGMKYSPEDQDLVDNHSWSLQHVYAGAKIGGSMLKFHRIVAERVFGGIPDGFYVHHENEDKLDNRRENLRLMNGANHNSLHKTGIYRGENSSLAKVTWSDVINIRELWATGEYTQYKLAILFGINQQSVSNIVNQRTWKNADRS